MALSWEGRIRLAAPLPATWMSNVVIHNVYVKYYTDVIGLEARYVGWVYLVFNIWNVLNDPVFGVLLDRMRHRPGHGKFVRVMRRTAPVMLLALAAMAWTDPGMSQMAIFAVLLAELFLFDVASTLYLISATSYYYLAAPTTADRVDVEVVRNWIANAVSFLATVVATQLLVGHLVTDRVTIASILMAVVAANGLVYLLALWKLPDPDHLYARGDASQDSAGMLWPDIRSILRMRAFWAWFAHSLFSLAPMGIYFTAYLYFMDHVIRAEGWQATVADTGSMILVLAALPLLARFVKRSGSRTAIWVGSLPYMLGFALLLMATTWWQVLGCYAIAQAGRYTMSTAATALDAVLVDDNELQTARRKTGQFAAVRALLSAPLAGIQLVLFTAILTRTGYDAGADVQSLEAQWGIRAGTALVPIVFCLAGMVPLLFVPYDRAREAEIGARTLSRREGGFEGRTRPLD